MIIDDDPHVNEVIRATLEMLGHQVATVETADDVLTASAEFKPDIALIDYNLPGKSGLEVLHDLAAMHPGITRYFATGMADFELLKIAVAAGANSMLCKPYRMTDLVALIDAAAALNAALHDEAATLAPDPAAANNASEFFAAADDSGLLARLIAFARRSNAHPDVAMRRLPVSAIELIKNARAHGAGNCQTHVSDDGAMLRLRVSDCGSGFDWRKALASGRACMDKGRASGLQLVTVMCDQLVYKDDGRVACAAFLKQPPSAAPCAPQPDQPARSA